MQESGEVPSDESLISQLIDRFVQEIADGEAPRIEGYLARVDERLHPTLLERLLPIVYRKQFDEGYCNTVEEFQADFPRHADLVVRVLLAGPGKDLWKYTLVRLLGAGAFGKVYLARDNLNRDVAIKFLDPEPGATAALLARFEQEIRIAGQLGCHPNVVTLFQQDRLENGRRMAVMQYVPGPTLRQHLVKLCARNEQAAVVSIVQILTGVADGLSHLQKGGLQAHRDLKPENILLDLANRPLISDFGLASLLDEGRIPLTLAVGTPFYMAPEQVRHSLGNEREDLHNCDIWALGVILYECLTGKQPFTGNDKDELYWNIEHAIPVPPRRLRDDPALNAGLERICLKCLEKRPDDRYATAADLRDELRDWLEAYQGLPRLMKEVRSFSDIRKQYESFTLRPSVIDEVKRFLAAHPKGVFVIKGPPGKGKSAITIHIESCFDSAEGHRPISFFFRKHSADPDICVRHIYASLAIQYGICDPETVRLPAEAAQAVKALQLLLRDVGTRVNASKPQLIILDALDEAKMTGDGTSAYDLVMKLTAELPEHVYVIATSRNVPALAAIHVDVPYVGLDLDDPDRLPLYRRELREYVVQRFRDLPRIGFDETMIDRVTEVADGNYLVAQLLCNELVKGGGGRASVEAILQELLNETGSNRLGYLYQRYVNRLWNDERIGDSVGRVLNVLAFAEADLTPVLIRAATGLPFETWRKVRAVLEEYLYIKPADPGVAQEDRIRVFHASFRDYLRIHVYERDDREAHRMLATACQRWREYADTSREYSLRYVVFHAIGGSADEHAQKLAEDYEFLETQAEAGFVTSLKNNLDSIAERLRETGNPASGLIQDFANAVWESMAFLRRHPSALFQCMWNALWWIDSPEAKKWQEPKPHLSNGLPGEAAALKAPRYQFMERWRLWKDRKSPGFSWIRAISPPTRRPGESFSLEGHTSFISALDTTSDGLTALSASGDRSLRLWDVTAARCIGKRDDTEARVDVIRFCEGVGGHGAFLGGDADGMLFLWDARSLARLARASSHHGDVTAIAVFHRGQWAVSGGEDGCLVVHELPSLRQIAHWQTEEHTLADGTVRRYSIHSVAIDPRAEEILYTVGTDIYRWNWRQNKCRKWLTGLHDGFHTLCDVSRDGSRIAAWFIENRDPECPTGGAVLSMEALDEIAHLDEDLHHEALTEVCTLGSGCSTETREIRLSPDGLRLAVADRAATYLVYWENPDIHISVPVPGTMPYPPGGVNCVAFADQGFVLCGSYNHSTIYACNPRAIERDPIPITQDARSLLRSLKGRESQTDFLLDPKGRYFVATYSLNSSSGTDFPDYMLRIGDPRDPRKALRVVPLETERAHGFLTCGAVSDNGNRVVFGLSSGAFMVLDKPQSEASDPYIVSLPILAPTNVSGDATEVSDESPADFDLPNGGSIRITPLGGHGIETVAISRAGGSVAVATHDGRVAMWHDGPHDPWVTPVAESTISTMVLSDDESWIAVGTVDGSVILLQASDGAILGRWECSEDTSTHKHGHPIVFLEIDNRNRRIACGSATGWLRWLDIETGGRSTIGRVKYFADYPSLLESTTDPAFRLLRDDSDIAVISPVTRQPVAWIPMGMNEQHRVVADRSVSFIITLGGDSRFYVREGVARG